MQWEEILTEELWRLSVGGHEAKAQKFPRPVLADDVACWAAYWIDGGDLHYVTDVTVAMSRAERALYAITMPMPREREGARAENLGDAAELAPCHRPAGSTPAGISEPFEATGEISRRDLKRTTRANLKTRPMGESTPEAYAVVEDEIRAAAMKVEAYARTVRSLVLAPDPDQVMALYAEAGPAATLEAALEVYREIGREEAQANALVRRIKGELASATEHLKTLQARLEYLRDSILGPTMASTGETRLDILGTTVRIVFCPPHVALDEDVEADPRLLPAEYQRWKVEPDKAAILATLKENGQIPGASLARRQKVEVEP